jgi:hypothetical protein
MNIINNIKGEVIFAAEVPLFAIVAVFCGGLYLSHEWIRDMQFYKNNHWDFKEPSGVRM